MKKFLSSILLAVTFILSSPSHAIIGIASDSEATAIAGLALMDISQIWVVESRTTTRRSRRGFSQTTYVTYRLITYPAFLIAGLVLLDDQGRAEITADLSAEQIAQADLTEEEISAFKAEIEEVNAIKDMIASEISSIENDELRTEKAGQLWTSYSEVLSKDTAIALFKLANLDK
ncbi:MAG: hypothetical protein K9K67_15205 [Bacteriovoracaceae bacterium]|nr:hypothetical protein [Bacteriovoracaceae bacterium]